MFLSEVDETLQPSYTNVSGYPETVEFTVLTRNGTNYTMKLKGTLLSTTTSSRLVSIVAFAYIYESYPNFFYDNGPFLA